MAIDVPGGILKQSDVRETITNTEETSVLFNTDFARFDFIKDMGLGDITDLYISPEGTELYVVNADDDVVQWTLATRWDLSTATLTRTLDVSGREASLYGISFKQDGTKMYIVGEQNDAIHEYDLTTPWDISTATWLQEFALHVSQGNPRGIYFREDGKQVYIPDSSTIASYHLSTAWNITTAQFLDSKSVTGASGMGGIHFSRDGSKVFYVDITNDILGIRELTAVFRISTAGAESIFTPFPAVTVLKSVFWNPNGTKMYLIDNESIMEYTIKRGWR